MGKSKRYTDPDWLKEQYIENGRSMSEIGDECGVYHGTIRYHMVKHDIPRREPKGIRKEYATHYYDKNGYEVWAATDPDETLQQVMVHRLVAISEWGFDAVCGNHVHHKNGIEWDNRPSNLEVISPEEHTSLHQKGSDIWEDKDTPWRDSDTLHEMYVEKDMSSIEIGERLGCSADTVCKWLREHDIPLSGMGRPPE